MSIKSQKDLLALLKIGRIVGLTLRYMQKHLRPGMTTEELDALEPVMHFQVSAQDRSK